MSSLVPRVKMQLRDRCGRRKRRSVQECCIAEPPAYTRKRRKKVQVTQLVPHFFQLFASDEGAREANAE
jgi:hypothetical protein